LNGQVTDLERSKCSGSAIEIATRRLEPVALTSILQKVLDSTADDVALVASLVVRRGGNLNDKRENSMKVGL
jgi:hypothetical protein